MKRMMRTLGALVVLAGSAVDAAAQTYPTKPVRIISDSAAGSAPDVILRIVADRLSQHWGQQVVPINQPGAGGSLAARAASSAETDGHTLLMAVSSAFVAPPGPAANIPLQVPRDFAAISLIGEQPMFITAAPATGFTALADLIAEAKRRPAELAYASTGRGRLSHLVGEMLQSRADIKLLMVPYAGGPAQALNDVMGGRVQILIEGGTALAGPIQSGVLRLLAVGSSSRLAEFKDTPTAGETIAGFTAAGWIALVAPAGTPDAVVRQVSADLRAVLTMPEVRSRLARIGSYARPTAPEETEAFIRGEQQSWRPILERIAASPP